MGLFRKKSKKKSRELQVARTEESVKPHKKGEIPEMAIALGMIRKDFFEIYNLCSGDADITKISEKSRLEVTLVKKIIQNLYKMAFIDISFKNAL